MLRVRVMATCMARSSSCVPLAVTSRTRRRTSAPSGPRHGPRRDLDRQGAAPLRSQLQGEAMTRVAGDLRTEQRQTGLPLLLGQERSQRGHGEELSGGVPGGGGEGGADVDRTPPLQDHDALAEVAGGVRQGFPGAPPARREVHDPCQTARGEEGCVEEASGGAPTAGGDLSRHHGTSGPRMLEISQSRHPHPSFHVPRSDPMERGAERHHAVVTVVWNRTPAVRPGLARAVQPPSWSGVLHHGACSWPQSRD